MEEDSIDMDEATFQRRADDTLKALFDSLVDEGDDHGFEVDLNAGTLAVEFDEPRAKFVVSPNSPVRQIWVSANVKSYKLDWSDDENTFVLGSSGQTLEELMRDAVGRHIGVNL
jgi:CyaY protein